MIVTTALKQQETLAPIAKQVSAELNVPYVPRNKQSLTKLKEKFQSDLLIVGEGRLDYYPYDQKEAIFFHPNVAMLRYKRLIRGKEDPFVTACELQEGMSLLDCTLGLGSDAIIASFMTGPNGKVVGVEAHPILAYIVKRGLKQIDTEDEQWNEALKRIDVIFGHHLDILKQYPDHFFDIVYFDPMFDISIDESTGIQPIRSIAHYESLTAEVIEEALRVAKHRVVLKDHWQSKRFDQFGFHVLKRSTAKFHFGYLRKKNH